MPILCLAMDVEKQIVLRTSRLMRVRSVRCVRSIFGGMALVMLSRYC